MPTNLPPEYFAAEKRYRTARTPAEKLVCLEEMLTIIPKHKGTDKLRADNRVKFFHFCKQRKGAKHDGENCHQTEGPQR